MVHIIHTKIRAIKLRNYRLRNDWDLQSIKDLYSLLRGPSHGKYTFGLLVSDTGLMEKTPQESEVWRDKVRISGVPGHGLLILVDDTGSRTTLISLIC